MGPECWRGLKFSRVVHYDGLCDTQGGKFSIVDHRVVVGYTETAVFGMGEIGCRGNGHYLYIVLQKKLMEGQIIRWAKFCKTASRR